MHTYGETDIIEIWSFVQAIVQIGRILIGVVYMYDYGGV